MDFDQMLTKLDNGEYHCAQDFLDDIDLVADNAVKYNSDLNYETNKVLCHRAKSLQDFAYALIKADMDTDFEENCKVCTVLFCLVISIKDVVCYLGMRIRKSTIVCRLQVLYIISATRNDLALSFSSYKAQNFLCIILKVGKMKLCLYHFL